MNLTGTLTIKFEIHSIEFDHQEAEIELYEAQKKGDFQTTPENSHLDQKEKERHTQAYVEKTSGRDGPVRPTQDLIEQLHAGLSPTSPQQSQKTEQLGAGLKAELHDLPQSRVRKILAKTSTPEFELPPGPKRKSNRYFIATAPSGSFHLSSNQAAFGKAHNLNNCNISNCLNGRQDKTKGWIFRYAKLNSNGRLVPENPDHPAKPESPAKTIAMPSERLEREMADLDHVDPLKFA